MRPTMETPVRAIRIPDDEVDSAMKKGEAFDLDELSAVVRLALRKLRTPRKEKA